MAGILQSIERILDEWELLETELMKAPGSSQADEVYEGIQRFKNKVDDMRTVLWAYLQARQRAGTIEDVLRLVRMERTKDMLRSVAEAVRQRADEGEPAVRTFFEQVQEIALDAVQKHCEGGSGAENSIPYAAPASNP